MDKMGIKPLHFVCTFIIWCLFSFWSKCSETSICTVVILPSVTRTKTDTCFSNLQTKLNYNQLLGKYILTYYNHNLIWSATKILVIVLVLVLVKVKA